MIREPKQISNGTERRQPERKPRLQLLKLEDRIAPKADKFGNKADNGNHYGQYK